MADKMNRKISLLRLFLIFFKIGFILFGGGYAILPFLKKEIVEKAKICSMEEIADYYALSQCFPGLVAGNVSMFIGYRARSVLGAFFAVLGICLPAFISIVLVFTFLSSISHIGLVQNIFKVLAIAVCVLILLTVLELWELSVKDRFSAFVFVVSLVAVILKISPFLIVVFAAVAGVLRFLATRKADSDA